MTCFFYVPKESIIWTSTYKHDCVHSAFTKIHCHCHSWSQRMSAYFMLGYSEASLSNGTYYMPQGINHLSWCNVLYRHVGHVCRHMTVHVCIWIGPDPLDQTSSKPYWADHQVRWCFMCDGVMLLFSFLAFKGDWYIISKFNVGVCVWNNLSAFQESNISSQMCNVWRCLACGTLRYLQDLNAKNMPNPVSWMMALSSSEICCLESVDITYIGIAFLCFSAGSLFLKNLDFHCRRNPVLPSSSRVGLSQSCSWNVWDTCELALVIDPLANST